MKFTWFNLMPWPHLPDNFREDYRSVWVDLPNSLYDPKKGHFVYHQYMDQLEYADSLGFDGIGVNEHHQNGYGLMPSPNIIAAGLARRTSQAALAVIGNSIALYNPPIRVAEEFAMLDVISGGRLLAGFPVGTSMDTNYCYGQIPAITRDKYAEAHELIMRAWAEEEPFAFDGKYNQLRWVNCWPKPVQQPHPPVYIPGGGSVETWDFCLDNDYNYSYLSFTGYLRGKQLMDGYWDRVCRPRQRRVAVPGRICPDHLCGRHRPGGRKTVRRARQLFLQSVFARLQRLCRRAGLPDDQDHQGECLERPERRHAADLSDPDLEQLLDEGYVIAGSPATVRDRMKDMIKGLPRRAYLLPDPHRQYAGLGRRATRPSCLPNRSCPSCATCGRTGRMTTGVVQAHGRATGTRDDYRKARANGRIPL